MAQPTKSSKDTKITINQTTVKVDLPVTTTSAGKKALLYNATENVLELGDASQGGSDSTPFNGNRPVALPVPGLQGKTLGGITTGEVLKNLLVALYPPQGPLASLTALDAIREFGSGSVVQLTYSVQAGDALIKTITLDGVAISTQAGSATLSRSTTQPNVDQTFTLLATDASNLQTQAQVGIGYRHNRFWFKSGANLLTQSDTDLSALLRAVPTREFATSRNQSRSFSLVDEYIYFAYAQDLGDASFLVGGLPNTAYQVKTFDYTNASGYTTSFRLYRSGSKGVGSIDVVLN